MRQRRRMLRLRPFLGLPEAGGWWAGEAAWPEKPFNAFIASDVKAAV